jgi:hypothetical protein
MKMKKITMIASATLLATFALTSCGSTKAKEAENINFASYTTKTTFDKYDEAHAKYLALFDLNAGYDLTKYQYTSTQFTSNGNEYVTVNETKDNEKFDKANSIISKDQSVYALKTESGTDGVAELNFKTIIQKNGEKLDIINENNKSFITEDNSLDFFKRDSIYLSSFLDTVTGSVSENDKTKVVEYYSDNNVYTLKLTINQEDEHEESGIQFKEKTNTETVFQFYVSDTEAYGKLTTNTNVELTYTDNGKNDTVKKAYKNVKYISLKLGAQTIAKVDTSSYSIGE